MAFRPSSSSSNSLKGDLSPRSEGGRFSPSMFSSSNKPNTRKHHGRSNSPSRVHPMRSPRRPMSPLDLLSFSLSPRGDEGGRRSPKQSKRSKRSRSPGRSRGAGAGGRRSRSRSRSHRRSRGTGTGAGAGAGGRRSRSRSRSPRRAPKSLRRPYPPPPKDGRVVVAAPIGPRIHLPSNVHAELRRAAALENLSNLK